jgi:hypothetical protein
MKHNGIYWSGTDIAQLVHFVTHTRMYIAYPENRDNIVSLITGYQLGRGKRFDFESPVKFLMAKKYKIEYSSDGWPGQIERYAAKQSTRWVITFKRITIELIGDHTQHEVARKKAGKMLKLAMESLINRIEAPGGPWFNDHWIESWKSLCLIENKWFKTLWTKRQWSVIKAVDAAVYREQIFVAGTYRPQPNLLRLKEVYGTAM